ncbi:thymidylate synthase [Nocardiopsis mwathae]|uniref:Thymidylate synthase n=1 Tax=Nocardiopsis mwathae TaxID=1472723 RepID=A0A7W9YMJ8_9ACTN|nr:thymidylate synthase [Nocardiopsis mwathae]MBB6174925.1 thymidylate synthase [Nocardiopsis mwathae]
MIPASFPSFHDAYAAVLTRLTTEPDHSISSRGNAAGESLDVSFRITDPRRRLPYVEARPVNVVFNVAEVLWYLAGRRDLDMIGYYAAGMATSSADGRTLTGTAYGSKLFARDAAGRTQWECVLSLLRSDPDSKRAVLSILDADEPRDPSHPDVSCTFAAQFFLRGGHLHLTCYLRGNDAYRGMVSDVFA